MDTSVKKFPNLKTLNPKPLLFIQWMVQLWVLDHIIPLSLLRQTWQMDSCTWFGAYPWMEQMIFHQLLLLGSLTIFTSVLRAIFLTMACSVSLVLILMTSNRYCLP